MKKIILFLMGFLIIGFTINKNFSDFSYIYKEIDLKEFLEENKEDPGWSNTFSPLIDFEGLINYHFSC